MLRTAWGRTNGWLNGLPSWQGSLVVLISVSVSMTGLLLTNTTFGPALRGGLFCGAVVALISLAAESLRRSRAR